MEKRSRINFNLPANIHIWLKKCAIDQGMSVTELATQAIREKLEALEKGDDMYAANLTTQNEDQYDKFKKSPIRLDDAITYVKDVNKALTNSIDKANHVSLASLSKQNINSIETASSFDIKSKSVQFEFDPMIVPVLLFLESKVKFRITRPLVEISSHIKHLKMPSIELIARVIKTLVLSIFRWHLCDRVLLKEGIDSDLATVIHSFDGKVSKIDINSFRLNYPYMLESAFILVLKTKKKAQEPSDFQENSVTPDSIRNYFQKFYQIKITDKEKGNTINDIFKSQYLKLVKP